uniref:Uncharacterized protein n=1 Tax=Apteryx owenii TaxID=8824 RepID=A0A8B9PDU8_APTOW
MRIPDPTRIVLATRQHLYSLFLSPRWPPSLLPSPSFPNPAASEDICLVFYNLAPSPPSPACLPLSLSQSCLAQFIFHLSGFPPCSPPCRPPSPPAPGTARGTPALGTARGPPAPGTARGPPVLGTAREPPAPGTAQGPPALGTARGPPVPGTVRGLPALGTGPSAQWSSQPSLAWLGCMARTAPSEAPMHPGGMGKLLGVWAPATAAGRHLSSRCCWDLFHHQTRRPRPLCSWGAVPGLCSPHKSQPGTAWESMSWQGPAPCQEPAHVYRAPVLQPVPW